MKINFKRILVVILLLTLLLPITYSYAVTKTATNVTEKKFFEISKNEVTKNEKIEMILNLDSIKYNEFLFELKSDETIENVEIEQNEKVALDKNNNEIIMEINKQKTNINTINLSYTIPDNKKAGDTIKFVATITNLSNDTELNKTEEVKKENTVVNETAKPSAENTVSNEVTKPSTGNTVSNETAKQSTGSTTASETVKTSTGNTTVKEPAKSEKESVEEREQEESETQTIELQVKIIEEKNDIKQEEQKKDTENNDQNAQKPSAESNTQNMQKPSTQVNTQNVQKTTTGSTTVKISTTSASNSNNISNTSSNIIQEAKVTYNGSDNNYLKELSVAGYTFNKEFSKENTTYFITVENDTQTLDFVANVEDSTAKTCIYGNENLKEGINKILICVTAENGNVRNYRIYVTKNS